MTREYSPGNVLFLPLAVLAILLGSPWSWIFLGVALGTFKLTVRR